MDAWPDRLRATSETFARERLERILREAQPFAPDAHVLYPADADGQHLRGFFAIEPVVRRPEFVDWIREDVAAWIEREDVAFDVLFAPAHPAVRVLARAIASSMGRPAAFWEYLPSGRFGSRLVEGSVHRGATALVFNGVTHTGRCVGQRLPDFVASLGGTAVAAAVFVKGTVAKVHETERRMGRRFYSALQADVPIYAPADCPLCRSTGSPPVPWPSLVAGARP